MKKSCVLLLMLVSLIFALSITAAAADKTNNKRYEAYGLCVVSKLMEYDESFNMEKYVDYDNYSKIISFWFGIDTLTSAMPTNADAVYDLSRFVPDEQNSGYTITSFKDFGFIEKSYRNAYKMMCKAGYLDFSREYLKPNYPLTYGVFFDLLMNFEEYAGFQNNFDTYYGMISDSYSESNNIILKQNTEGNEKVYKFNRMHSFYVQDGANVLPYSYNIKRGIYAKIYTLDDDIIFVSIDDKEINLDENYEISQARIFLCNEYDRQIIFINNISGTYMTYPYDDALFIYENDKKLNLSDINNILLDRYCYFITDKESNTIKYINVIG